MAGINETFKEGGIVTKNDMRSVFWRSFPLQASFNYERMQNVGFCYSLLPVLKRLYPEKKEASEALKRHLSFFNTTPQLVTFITGACIAMEEENKKSVDQFDIESIAALKAALTAISVFPNPTSPHISLSIGRSFSISAFTSAVDFN